MPPSGVMRIRVVLLCAGYGTRLSKDLEEDRNSIHGHLIGVPKPLLPIANKPLIAHWIEIFENVLAVSEVFIVSNELHKTHYESFLKQLNEIGKPVFLASDGSHSNETRSGAISCMQLGVQDLTGDVLFLAGDTLLDKQFTLEEMISRFNKLKLDNEKVCLLISAPVREENVSKHGIIEVDGEGRVTSFIEKPQPHETASRLQSPCCYMMSRSCLPIIREFLEATEGHPLSARDATGNFISYLLSKAPIFAFPVQQRYDIGNLKSYTECCQSYM